jgi:hypothetical protein
LENPDYPLPLEKGELERDFLDSENLPCSLFSKEGDVLREAPLTLLLRKRRTEEDFLWHYSLP